MAVDNRGTPLGAALRWLLLAATPTMVLVFFLSVSVPLDFDRLSTGTLEAVLLTSGRWLGIGIAGWLIATQVLYTLATLTRTTWLVDTLRPLTLPVVRRASAAAASLLISMSGIAAAQTGPETPVVVIEEGSTIPLRQEATPTPSLKPLVEVDTVSTTDVVNGSYIAPLTWLVRPGDHLWKIAGEHLTIVLDRPPTDDEHSRYWVEVVEAAETVIRSGNPDLIYPGEEVPLPPLLDAGIRR